MDFYESSLRSACSNKNTPGVASAQIKPLVVPRSRCAQLEVTPGVTSAGSRYKGGVSLFACLEAELN